MASKAKQPESKPVAVDPSALEEAVRTLESANELPESLRDRVKGVLETHEAAEAGKALVATLKSRFEAHPENHKGVEWAEFEEAIAAHPEDLASALKLERSGGEIQIVGIEGDEFILEDRSAESPSGRRNLTFSQADAQRKSFGPNVRFQSPDSYKAMQKTGKFDLNSGSWLETDAKTRDAGHAMYGNRIGDVVSVSEDNAAYHLDPSYGWRASLRVKKA
jgi:Protein of unknown function (DUF4256)